MESVGKMGKERKGMRERSRQKNKREVDMRGIWIT